MSNFKKTLAVYPGSFDPITNGHVSIIKKSLLIFDELIIAVLNNKHKEVTFTVDDRINMIDQSCLEILPSCLHSRIKIECFSGLLVNFLAKKNIKFAVRGLRIASDFEYEFKMNKINKDLNDDFETIFLLSDHKYSIINSTIVKEISLLGGDVSKFVSNYVKNVLQAKYHNNLNIL